MLTKNKSGFYEFEEFKKIKNLIHGISTRKFGDSRLSPEKFLKKLGLDKKNLVLAEQSHQNKIQTIKTTDRGKTIPKVDGLITSVSGLILGILTADCLPILFFVPETKTVGICHAGWNGVLGLLPQKMIDRLILLGADPQTILVAIGPFIGPCCYNIGRERADRFFSVFGKIERMIIKRRKDFYLDLAVPVGRQLLHSGILPDNLISADKCTACDNEQFFSYRLNRQSNYGNMLTVIGLK